MLRELFGLDTRAQHGEVGGESLRRSILRSHPEEIGGGFPNHPMSLTESSGALRVACESLTTLASVGYLERSAEA